MRPILNAAFVSLGALALVACSTQPRYENAHYRDGAYETRRYSDDGRVYEDTRYATDRYDDTRYTERGYDYGRDDDSGTRYERDDRYVRTRHVEQRTYDRRCNACGTVERIEDVWVQHSGIGGGAILGAVIGGAAGSTIGSGSGRRAAIVAGAIAGGIVGNEIESDRRDQRRGQRLVVRLDDDRLAEVTQLGTTQLQPGDRVEIRDQHVHALR